MIPYWLQLIAGVGATSIIIYGSIFNRPRGWLKSKHDILKDFLSCSMCVGFWVGLAISYHTNTTVQQHIIVALACSASSWLYDSVVGASQAREVFLTNKLNQTK